MPQTGIEGRIVSTTNQLVLYIWSGNKKRGVPEGNDFYKFTGDVDPIGICVPCIETLIDFVRLCIIAHGSP